MTPSKRHIGIVGGLGVGATVIYYEQIAAKCAARGLIPRLTITHADSATARSLVAANDISGLARYLAGFCDTLTAAGCDQLVIPAITPHICRAELRPLLKRPLIDMLDTTVAAVQSRRLKRIALLGSRFTIEQRMFGVLDGFDLVTPPQTEIDAIDRIYIELTQQGRTAPDNVEWLRATAKTWMSRDGVECILLAGTDLNVVFTEQTAGFPALDCAAAHVDAIVAQMA